MLDGHCRQCLTEGWACLWSRVGERGEEAKVLHREGRGQRGPGCVWGEGSQKGRGKLPPQGGLFQERLSARGSGQGGESSESGYEKSIP